MPIEVQCGQCGRKISAPDKFAGKRVKCPKCSATIVVEAVAKTEEAAAGGKKEAVPAGKKEAEPKPAVQPLVGPGGGRLLREGGPPVAQRPGGHHPHPAGGDPGLDRGEPARRVPRFGGRPGGPLRREPPGRRLL